MGKSDPIASNAADPPKAYTTRREGRKADLNVRRILE
jgi:hypothetical protein